MLQPAAWMSTRLRVLQWINPTTSAEEPVGEDLLPRRKTTPCA